jgi:hypothetical protein
VTWPLFAEAAQPDLKPIEAIIGTPRGFDEPTAAALRRALPQIDTAPTSIRAADDAQQQLIDVFRAHGHHGAAFLIVYHGITVAVLDAVERGDLGPRAFFERLDGRFAERHFDGVKVELGLDTTSDAARYNLWAPSFALDNIAPDPSTPLGMKAAMAHFTVGMCCHINFDLACALDETIRELGFASDPAALAEIERGHNFVDTILAEQVERSTELLATEMACPMSRKIRDSGAVKTVGEVSMAMIRRWRAKTFVHAMQLCRAPDEAARAQIRAEIYKAGARKTVRLFNTLPSLVEGTLRGTWLANAQRSCAVTRADRQNRAATKLFVRPEGRFGYYPVPPCGPCSWLSFSRRARPPRRTGSVTRATRQTASVPTASCTTPRSAPRRRPRRRRAPRLRWRRRIPCSRGCAPRRRIRAASTRASNAPPAPTASR